MMMQKVKEVTKANKATKAKEVHLPNKTSINNKTKDQIPPVPNPKIPPPPRAQVPRPQDLYMRWRGMMRINGPLLLSLMQSCLRNRKSCRKFENNSSKRKLKNNLISKWRNVKEKGSKNWKKNKNIKNCNRNKSKIMIKGKNKKGRSIKGKFNLKRKWGIGKLKRKIKGKNKKRKEKINLIIFLSRKLKKKLLKNNNKRGSEKRRKFKDSNKPWPKINKTKENSKKKLKEKD